MIERVGEFSNASKYGEFVVTQQFTGQVRFVQLINGIPVIARNQIHFDLHGRIREVWLSVFDPERAPKSDPITKERAMEIASLEYAKHLGIAHADVEPDEYRGLYYTPTPRPKPLKLQYRFLSKVSGRGGDYVLVDAIDGTTQMGNDALP